MCFSLAASLVASGGLAVVGGAAMYRAKTTPDKLLAAVPLLFATQQLIEGLQWQRIAHGNPSLALGYAMLSFAYVLWPLYLPRLFRYIDRDATHDNLHRIFVALGTTMTLILALALLFSPLSIHVVDHHIDYQLLFPARDVIAVLYVIAVCGGAIINRRPWIRLFGCLTLAGSLFSLWYSYVAFTSVWCFLYAALSILIYAELRKIRA